MTQAQKEFERKKNELHERVDSLLYGKDRPRFWDVVAQLRGYDERPAQDVVDNISLLKKSRRIMDIGCQSGRNTVFLAKEIPEAQITGFDFSKKALDILEARIEREKLGNIRVMHGTATDIRVKDASFDAVLSQFVLMHMKPSERREAVDEMRRILQPGGIVLASENLPEKELRGLFGKFRIVSLEKSPVPVNYWQHWILIAEKVE